MAVIVSVTVFTVIIFTTVFVAIVVAAFSIITLPIICQRNTSANKNHKGCNC